MDCDEAADTQHIRVLPDTCVELFINYTCSPIAIIDHELHKRSIISFRMSRPMDVQMRKGTGCLAICFHPGMAYHFFRLPMHVMTDRTVPLSEIWGDKAMALEDQLAGSCNNDARVKLAQEYLLQELGPDKQDSQLVYCLNQSYLSEPPKAVTKLTNALGISQRHLARKFQQYIGLSPKEYLRVCRFIRSLEHLKKYPVLSLTEIAYESGYYDQSHFNRDYKIYTGHSPGELVHSKHILY